MDIPQSSYEFEHNWNDVGPKVTVLPVDLSYDSFGRKFKSWADQSRHSKSLHFKDDLKCDSCDVTCSRWDHYIQHVRVAHDSCVASTEMFFFCL